MSRLEVGTESYSQILRRMIVPAIFVGALFVVYWLRAPRVETSPEMFALSGATMGTTFTVKVVADVALEEGSREALAGSIDETLAAVDESMSTWRSDSELSRFNRHGIDPFPLSPPLLEVMSAALEVGAASQGAFDVTVGPLVDAWGFGSDSGTAAPSAERIVELLETTGARNLELDTTTGTLRKSQREVRCDLSAIAKGYAVDRLVEGLVAAGYTSFMVEVGGEVVARGRNAEGEPWRIGIEVPDPQRRAVHTVVALDGAALATSGNYRNFRFEDGSVVSHIIDPRTGYPVTHSLASVSVIAATGISADAWATALSVLGPDEGMDIALGERLPVLFISRRRDGELEESSTPAFDAYRTVDFETEESR